MSKPILCLDFDGVLHSYESGWKGADVIPDPPVPGAIEFLARAVEHFDVQIFSSRSNQTGGIEAMQAWLRVQVMQHFDCVFAGSPRDLDAAIALLDAISFPREKPPAFLSIDDRALTFTGKWPNVKALLEFKPWNR